MNESVQPDADLEVIVIVTVPLEIAVIKPLSSIVATFGALEVNATCWILASAGLIAHSNWNVSNLLS